MQLDDVHRRHRQPRAIYQTRNAAIQPNVIQTELTRCHLTRIFLSRVPHRHHILLPVERVVIKIELRIQRHHFAILRHRQRIHFDLGTVTLRIQIPQGREQLHRLIHQLAAQTKRRRQLPALIRLQSQRRIQRHRRDLLWRLLRHLFDVHPTLSRSDDRMRAVRAIKQNREIQFLVDINRLRDQHLAHQLPFWPRLMRHQGLPQHLPCNRLRFLGRVDDMHTSFESILECSLPASSRMNLRLHHQARPTQFPSCRTRRLRRVSNDPCRAGNPKF